MDAQENIFSSVPNSSIPLVTVCDDVTSDKCLTDVYDRITCSPPLDPLESSFEELSCERSSEFLAEEDVGIDLKSLIQTRKYPIHKFANNNFEALVQDLNQRLDKANTEKVRSQKLATRLQKVQIIVSKWVHCNHANIMSMGPDSHIALVKHLFRSDLTEMKFAGVFYIQHDLEFSRNPPFHKVTVQTLEILLENKNIKTCTLVRALVSNYIRVLLNKFPDMVQLIFSWITSKNPWMVRASVEAFNQKPECLDFKDYYPMVWDICKVALQNPAPIVKTAGGTLVRCISMNDISAARNLIRENLLHFNSSTISIATTFFPEEERDLCRQGIVKGNK